MEFLVAHISFVPLVQRKLVPTEYEGKPIELAEKLLSDNLEYVRSKTRYHVNLIFDNFNYDDEKRLISGKIGLDKKAKLPKHDKNGFHRDINEISPFVNFLWDGKDQFILIEKNMTVFTNYEYVFNSVQSHLATLMESYNWGVFIEPITEEKDFWNAYNRFSLIYEISFEFHMPNAFGRSQKELAESLKEVNSEFNATSFSQTLSNSDGQLTIKQDDNFIETALKWITNGAGSWLLKGKRNKSQKRKVRVSSKKAATIKTEDLDLDPDNHTISQIQSVIQKIKPKLLKLREPTSAELKKENK